MLMRNYFMLFAVALLCLASCKSASSPALTKAELSLVNDSAEVMRILSIDNEKDFAVLRNSSIDLNQKDISSPIYNVLSTKLIKTLESTENGVGLAGPQIGINRRIVAVMRLDKEGEPIEVYPNIKIEEMRGDKQAGYEGCLSVPDISGDVLRYRDISISYSDVNNGENVIREDISGFTAVIFQHEVDHLEGIIYTDKLESQ